MFGGTTSQERYFPVHPREAYSALQCVAGERFKLKKSDDFSKSCEFSSGASAFTWGENFTAQVVPAEGGSTVRVQAVGKVGGQIQHNSRSSKLTNQLFDSMVVILKS